MTMTTMIPRVLLALLLAAPLAAQGENGAAPVNPAPAPAGGEDDGTKKPPEKRKTTQLTMKNASIQVVEQWLGKTTGKTIIKHPKVKCKLNILSPGEIPVDDAVLLVYQALALEGFSAIESADVIMIVPTDMESSVSAELMRAGADTQGGRRIVIRVFELEHAKADKIKDKLKPVLSDKAKLEVDERSGKIIVRDYLDNVRFIDELIGQLDVATQADIVTQVYNLKYKQADELSELLMILFTGAPPPSARSRSRSSTKNTTGISILPDTTSNRLVVIAPRTKLPEIEKLIGELDTQKPADVTVRLIDLKNVDAEELQRELSQMYRKITGKTLQERIEISANKRSNSLIVMSSRENFEAIKKIVETLDTKEGADKEMRTYRLQYAEAEEMAKQLEELHSAQDESSSRYYYYRSRNQDQFGKLRFVASRRKNEIMVIGTPGALDRVEDLIKKLDQPAGDENLAPRIYPLKFVAAKDVEEVLNGLFKKTERRSYWWDDEYDVDNPNVGRLYGKVRIASEPYTNSLIVTTNSTENFLAVERMIEQLDSRQADREATLTYPLRHAKAITVANNVNILFAGAGAPPRRAQPRNNNANNNNGANGANGENGPTGFELEADVTEDTYFPWLGGGNQGGGSRGRNGSQGSQRPVSDLIGKVRIVPDMRTNSLMITTAPHFFPQIQKVIKDLDVPTPQVLIEAKIIEVSREDSDRIGVRWSPDGSQVFDADDLDGSFAPTGNVEYRSVFTGTLLENAFRTGVFDSMVSLDVLIQFLSRTTDTRVRAEPRLNVADNERGKLFVGSSIPFIDTSQFTTEGAQNSTFEYKDVGITLEVTPHINQDGQVTLQVRVEASQIRPGETLFGGAIIDTRNYRTEMTVHDRDTLVLGGIIQREQSEVDRKIPLLGDIPLLGYLFRKTDTVDRDVELMVFLRATVTRTPEEVAEMMREERSRTPNIHGWAPEVSGAIEEPKDVVIGGTTKRWSLVSW